LRHPVRWLLVAIAVVVLAVGGFAAWWIFGDDAPPEPELSARRNDAAAAGDGPSTPDGTWRVVAGEEVFVGYRIKELFGGATIKKDAVGRTPDTTGTVTIADGSVAAATISADLTTLDSNRAARDSYLRENALETNEFPEATFELTRPIRLPGSVEQGADIQVDATGNLTMHGATKPVTVTLDARWDGTTIEVAGTAPLVLADFGIEPPDTPVAAVDDNGSLELHLVLERGQ
jgi:polyisoprenoid-binding protein YceI